MTLQDMQDQVSDELRNKTISDKILRWLNMATVDLATTFVFKELHAYNQTLVGPLPDLSLGSDFLWIKTMEIPGLQRKIYEDDEQRISEISPDYRTLQGTTTHYYFNGPIKVGLYKVPSSINQFTWSYQRRPTAMVAPTDICSLSEEWHSLVIQKACTYGFNYQRNPDSASKSLLKEGLLLRNLGSMVYRRIGRTSVLGEGQYQGRPGRPKLPSNYPSTRY